MNNRPKIVYLCGSTRFSHEFQKQNINETLEGKIVLSIAPFAAHDDITFAHLSKQDREKLTEQLDILHKHKIDLADEVLIINIGGYSEKSTQSELEYAHSRNKIVRFLEEIQI